MSAFLYLVTTSARNRFWFQLQRARNPRYAVALAAAGLYIWTFLIRPTSVRLGDIFLTPTGEVIAALLIATTLSGAWVFGSDRLALAFTQAELSLLFPAPVSRRALIGYKLYRAQIAVLFNALIWVFVLRRGGTALAAPLRALSVWMLFSTLNLHRLGAALVRASWGTHGRAGLRRNALAVAAFVAVAGLLVAGMVIDRARLLSAHGAGEFFLALTDVFSRAPAAWGLWPFRLIVAPAFARGAVAWSAAAVPAALVMGLHVWWVLRSDAAFEDAAVEASAERARRQEAFRNRRSMGGRVSAPTARTGAPALAAHGHPALAIVWKNMLCLRRTAEVRVLIGPAVMALVLGAAVSDGGSDPALFIAAGATTFAVMLLVFGGRLIRNDLRHDMLHLPMLKTLPISPRDLVLAEVASSALPMAALQLLLVAIAFTASFATSSLPLDVSVRLGILVAAPVAALSLNAALLTIQNGLAVLFPAWMRLGSTVNTGVEALGQNLIATMANLLSLAFALVVPMLIAFVGVRYLFLSGALAIAATIIFASAVLALETFGVVHYLAGAFARAEPQATA